MAATIELVAHDLMGAPRPGVLVKAIYQIVAWNPYESGDGTAVRDQVDFATAAGGGTGVTLRLQAAGGNIPARYQFRNVFYASPMVLVGAPAADVNGIVAEMRRAGATAYDLAALWTGDVVNTAFDEVAEGTDLTSFVAANPSHARFMIIGQPESDLTDTPLLSTP